MKLGPHSVWDAFSRPSFGWIRTKWSMPLAFMLITLVFPINAIATFSPTGSLIGARSDHAAVLLPNGKVLVALIGWV